MDKPIMNIKYGKGTTTYGTGIDIELTGDEVAIAIDAYLTAHDINVSGAKTITVNGELIQFGNIYVYPSGFVIHNGEKILGRGKDC